MVFHITETPVLAISSFIERNEKEMIARMNQKQISILEQSIYPEIFC